MLFNIVTAKMVEASLKVRRVCRASFDHDATSDEGRNRWTFYIITIDGMADFHLESLHFAPLNLAGKGEILPMRTSSK